MGVTRAAGKGLNLVPARAGEEGCPPLPFAGCFQLRWRPVSWLRFAVPAAVPLDELICPVLRCPKRADVEHEVAALALQ